MVGKRRPIASCNQTLSGFPGAQGESREERGQCGLGKSNLSLICARCLLSEKEKGRERKRRDPELNRGLCLRRTYRAIHPPCSGWNKRRKRRRKGKETEGKKKKGRKKFFKESSSHPLPLPFVSFLEAALGAISAEESPASRQTRGSDDLSGKAPCSSHFPPWPGRCYWRLQPDSTSNGRVDVLSAGPIVPPPQECIRSERTQTTETAVLMDAQAKPTVKWKQRKRSPEDTSPAKRHTHMLQLQPIESQNKRQAFQETETLKNDI
ncbi:uncharacterized protein LOC132369554 [Balaenoptera ricei]|uniref:uncharacterized protein LOC132369554 n=1 Tax=Balaenoptera ricei TaxID=2746895 RepID=UPI0028BDFF25|nr:uncharacterized protein LOC132369554 [Balaenoptera ricei]